MDRMVLGICTFSLFPSSEGSRCRCYGIEAMQSEPTRVLFVCLGNICRSPAAEAVFRSIIADRDLESRFEVDSAGTGGWHEGDRADPRSRAEGKRRGHRVDSTARQIRDHDLEHHDVIVCMDRANHQAMIGLGTEAGKVRLLLEWHAATDLHEVPDPYYGGEDGFVHMYDLIEAACEGLLEDLLMADEAS